MSSTPLHPFVSGYIAARLLDGTYHSIPVNAGVVPRRIDELRIMGIWAMIEPVYPQEVYEFFFQRQPWYPDRDRDMHSVLNGLKRHSLSLFIEVSHS